MNAFARLECAEPPASHVKGAGCSSVPRSALQGGSIAAAHTPNRAAPRRGTAGPARYTERSRPHDYVRPGTTTTFAALEVATGKMVDTCVPRHRHQEFLKFSKQVAKAYPCKKRHIVCYD